MTDTNAQKLRIDFLSRLHPDNEVRARPLENHEPAYQLINRSPSRIHITGSVFSWMNHKGQEQACLLCFRIRTRNCQKNSRRRSLEHFDHEERFLNLTSSLMDQNYGISQFFDYFNSSRGLKKLTQINRACDKFPIVIWQVFSTLITLASQRSEQVEYISNISCGCCWKDL